MSPDPNETTSRPLTTTDAANGIVMREALDSLNTLRSIPKDLHQIADTLSETTKPRHGIFLVYAFATLVIATMAYFLITSHLNEILSANQLRIADRLEQTRRENQGARKDVETAYRKNIDQLNTNITEQSKTINAQLETNYNIMHDAYKKREQYLNDILKNTQQEHKQLKLEFDAIKKDNQRLHGLIDIIDSEKRKAAR